jgi:CheY-like chemotaxis protein
VPELERGDWVRVSVTDTGEGIPPEVMPHIFEPFFTTKAVGRGTGLGLAQVYGIIKQHGGHIDVRSRRKGGTRFTLYLPAQDLCPAHGVEQESRMPAQGHGELILVVEDDPATRDAVAGILEMLNYRVLTASSGVEALRTLDRSDSQFALVLTDLVMPGIGGVRLFQALQERNPDLKVVVMTGYPLREDAREVLDRGTVGWVQKPIKAKELAGVIQAALHPGSD